MSMCASVVPLEGAPGAAGLLDDVGDLGTGRVRLRLRGRFVCRDVQRAFYHFDILDAGDDSIMGEITFMPERDANVVGPFGHSGGGLVPEARGTGLYGDALRALGPLAERHGLNEFTVAIPATNAAAIRSVEKLDLRLLDELAGRQRFVVPSRFPVP